MSVQSDPTAKRRSSRLWKHCCIVGIWEGGLDGICEGATEGALDGLADGPNEGDTEGVLDGPAEGHLEGV